MALGARFENLNPTRQSLLVRLKDWEDQESWMQFFNTYWRLVYSVGIRAGLTQAEAEDAVQETFITVSKKIREFNYDPALGLFRNWLIHTTQFRVKDQFRKRKKQVLVPQTRTNTEQRTATIERIPDEKSLDLEKICDEEWEKNLFLLAVERVKKQVSAKHFQIFDLYVLKNWPVPKVASTLGVNRAQVHLAKCRIAKLVKKQLEELKRQSI